MNYSIFPWYWPNWTDTSDTFTLLGKPLTDVKYSLKDKEDKYVVEVDLPGYTKDEISISYENKVLNVRAKNKDRGVSSLSLQLKGLSNKDIKASLDNGVLSVVFTRDPPESTLIKIT